MRKEQTSHKNEHNTLMCFPLEPVFIRDGEGVPNFMDEATSGLDPIIRDDILDILIDFVQDENHSVLVSSHIISDLEKVADYITFIHKGKLVFTHSKDELVDNYGVMSCGAMVFDNLDKSEIIAYRKEDYQYKVLVKDRHIAEKKYPKAIVVPAAIEEIMLFYVKGEMK